MRGELQRLKVQDQGRYLMDNEEAAVNDKAYLESLSFREMCRDWNMLPRSTNPTLVLRLNT